MRKIVWLFLIAILGIAGWSAWALLMPVAPSGQKFVMLRPGFSTRRIAAELKNAGIIRSQEAFVLWHYLHPKRSLKAGEYLFDKPANIIEIQKRLRRGDVYFHTVVVPEGFTMFDIARAIEDAGLGPAQDFLKVAQTDTSLIADIAPGARSLEGYLFPDTYQFSRMMSMQEMAQAMVCQFHVVAKQIGLINGESGEAVVSGSGRSGHLCGVVIIQTRDANDSPSITPEPSDIQRTVTMASIVEKETAVPEERPMVASVYYNRLNKNIALDADPSIIYGELLSGTYQGALHHADMQFSSPYNTYRHAGLPPGPIGNPGRSALEAAMHPAHSDFYYFVADAQGHHRFARTIEEHNKNVVAYRQAMRGR
ncbi:MAG TPA: endolytic transglycosylase MltG [Candidatus Sulfotelmatobacter sp.]|nr:endolytic transglycosylase MltG [Candidatus Sulfotelmatobacter sp.]